MCIDDLKYAVFEAWTNRPNVGLVTVYYDIWDFYYEKMMNPITDFFEQLIDISDEDDKIKIGQLICEKKLSKKFFQSVSFDNGDIGFKCIVFEEGRKITEAAISFMYSHFELYEVEEEYKNIKTTIKNAQNNSGALSDTIKLLELISGYIEKHNEPMLYQS